MALAEKLGKTIREIEQIELSEYNEWVAYYKILEDKSNG